MAKHKIMRIAAALLFFGLACVPARAATRGEVLNRLEDFRQFFVKFQYAPDSAIPGELLADCYGVIIMRQYKAGFVFGAKGGDGVIMMHDRYTGEWSAPAFVRMAEGSFGFQIGGQAIDAIILIMNQAGVNMLLKTRFSIGVDASAAAGPIGRDLSAAVGPGTALLTYSRAKGLFAGASFEGGAMFNNDGYNRALYGMNVGLRDILMDRRVSTPREVYPMIETLKSYAVRNTASATPVIPAPAPRPAYRDDYRGEYRSEYRGDYRDDSRDGYYDDRSGGYRDDGYRAAPSPRREADSYRPDKYQDNASYADDGRYDAPVSRERTAGGLERRPDFGGTADLFDSPYGDEPVAEGRELPGRSVPYDAGTRRQQDLEDDARRAAVAAENAARAAREAAEAAERAAERAADARNANAW